MSNEIILGILLLAPTIGFLFNGLRFKSKNYLLAGTVATLAAATSFACGVVLFTRILDLPEEARQIYINYFSWAEIGSAKINFSFMFDEISALMTLIITGVGSLIHLFSVGYMSHDERPSKYFAYLNLFLALT